MSTNTQDYAGLTDAELTRAVAEKRGWRDLEPFGYTMMIGNRYHKKVFYEGTEPTTSKTNELVPDYSADLAAALPLLREMNQDDDTLYALFYDHTLRQWGVLRAVHLDWNEDSIDEAWCGGDTRDARAICLAWLAWKDERE